MRPNLLYFHRRRAETPVTQAQLSHQCSPESRRFKNSHICIAQALSLECSGSARLAWCFRFHGLRQLSSSSVYSRKIAFPFQFIHWIDHAMETQSGVPSSGLGLILFIVHSFLCISRTSAVSADALCYTGSGNVSADFPCDLSQDTSLCCAAGWSCLSNGLCQYRESTTFAEGTCTDKTFPANSCLGICLASMLPLSSYHLVSFE